MSNLPLHPALVHLPLGLAIFLPLLAIAFAVGIWRGWLSEKSWAIVAFFHLILFASAYVALQTGENDEEKVEKVVVKTVVEEHEEKADVFFWASGLTLILSGGASLIRKDKLGAAARTASVLGLLAVAGLSLQVGHSGGALVYQYGAAQAHIGPGGGKAEPGGEVRGPEANPKGEEAHDND